MISVTGNLVVNFADLSDLMKLATDGRVKSEIQPRPLETLSGSRLTWTTTGSTGGGAWAVVQSRTLPIWRRCGPASRNTEASEVDCR